MNIGTAQPAISSIHPRVVSDLLLLLSFFVTATSRHHHHHPFTVHSSSTAAQHSLCSWATRCCCILYRRARYTLGIPKRHINDALGLLVFDKHHRLACLASSTVGGPQINNTQSGAASPLYR